MTEPSRPEPLDRLMLLAEKLVLKLVVGREMPPGVLLVEQAGDLHV